VANDRLVEVDLAIGAAARDANTGVAGLGFLHEIAYVPGAIEAARFECGIAIELLRVLVIDEIAALDDISLCLADAEGEHGGGGASTDCFHSFLLRRILVRWDALCETPRTISRSCAMKNLANAANRL